MVKGQFCFLFARTRHQTQVWKSFYSSLSFSFSTCQIPAWCSLRDRNTAKPALNHLKQSLRALALGSAISDHYLLSYAVTLSTPLEQFTGCSSCFWGKIYNGKVSPIQLPKSIPLLSPSFASTVGSVAERPTELKTTQTDGDTPSQDTVHASCR